MNLSEVKVLQSASSEGWAGLKACGFPFSCARDIFLSGWSKIIIIIVDFMNDTAS